MGASPALRRCLALCSPGPPLPVKPPRPVPRLTIRSCPPPTPPAPTRLSAAVTLSLPITPRPPSVPSPTSPRPPFPVRFAPLRPAPPLSIMIATVGSPNVSNQQIRRRDWHRVAHPPGGPGFVFALCCQKVIDEIQGQTSDRPELVSKKNLWPQTRSKSNCKLTTLRGMTLICSV